MNKWGVGLTFLLAATSVMAKDIQLLNVSYDPTRELYEQYNKAFSAHWKQQTGDNVVIRQSHGGSGKQGEKENDYLACYRSWSSNFLCRCALAGYRNQIFKLFRHALARYRNRVWNFKRFFFVGNDVMKESETIATSAG